MLTFDSTLKYIIIILFFSVVFLTMSLKNTKDKIKYLKAEIAVTQQEKLLLSNKIKALNEAATQHAQQYARILNARENARQQLENAALNEAKKEEKTHKKENEKNITSNNSFIDVNLFNSLCEQQAISFH